MTAAKKILHSPAEISPREAWNKNILVVDDEPEIASIYRDILAAPKSNASGVQSSRAAKVVPLPEAQDRFHFDVTVAGTAREALMAVERMKSEGRSFAMGFFDVRLGEGIDGIELVREIHKTFPDMYAVFVTAYNDRTIDSITSTLGPTRVDHWDYMNKPFNASEITQKARNFVSLWNLQKASEEHTELMAELNRKVLESERITSVAAVARGVAHEFGNLLMQIMGKAEVSRNKSPEEMQKALDKIIDASQRAHEILDRFNHLSDTKNQATYKQKTTVENVVNEALDLLSHQFKKQNIKICIIKRDHVEAKIHSTSILQVLVNLFINAIHAMGNSGQIDISVTSLGSDFEIRVRDYGPGVPDELLEKVTEPFFTTKGDKGTGLGLAISREIVEIDHHGEFKLQNHPGQGLEVVIRIPCEELKHEKV